MEPEQLSHPQLFAYWFCECGHEEARKSGEACKGRRQIYRVEPCPVCRRTMGLVMDGGRVFTNRWD